MDLGEVEIRGFLEIELIEFVIKLDIKSNDMREVFKIFSNMVSKYLEMCL